MTSFVSGADRTQGTMFLERLEDYVAGDNPVRVIHFFVDQLALGELGFGRVRAKLTGKHTHRFPAAVFFTVGNTDELRQLKLGRRVDPL